MGMFAKVLVKGKHSPTRNDKELIAGYFAYNVSDRNNVAKLANRGVCPGLSERLKVMIERCSYLTFCTMT
jgi:hypothetical protein